MFDGLFNGVSWLLNFFYELVPNYAVAIALLTLAVMAVTTPLTLKGTRSMLEMQRLQPEMRRIQQKHKDDPQKRNEELMAFYQEHGINPLGGCLPLLLQAPIFIILFNVIRGLTHRPDPGAPFDPKYLDHHAELYTSLKGKQEMLSFGIDLSDSAQKVLGEDFVRGLPYLVLAVAVGILALYQQRQIQGRSVAEIPGPQKMIGRLFTGMFVLFAFVSPAALVVYFLVSTAWRVAMQAYITRTLYRGEHSPGAQAAQAMKELRSQKADGVERPRLMPNLRGNDAGKSEKSEKKPAPADEPASKPARSDGSRGGSSRPGGPPAPTSRTTPAHPRSRKKKKRR